VRRGGVTVVGAVEWDPKLDLDLETSYADLFDDQA